LAALILYDLVIKSFVAGIFPSNKYDNTFDPSGKNIPARVKENKRQENISRAQSKHDQLRLLVEGHETNFRA
jgi:hypothetical protein